jgi:hypothetical protein
MNYEKNRNEKIRNMVNPFKFGAIVEAEHVKDFWAARSDCINDLFERCA